MGGKGEVHDVSRLDDQAPAGPDQACTCEGDVLCEGELFGGAVKVRDASEDEAPLLHGYISILFQSKLITQNCFWVEFGLVL
jgi:hypothetical protein